MMAKIFCQDIYFINCAKTASSRYINYSENKFEEIVKIMF